MTGLFLFCQVIGVMCAIPDLAMGREAMILSEGTMACPMDGTIMCPPSITSSPERQIKHSMVMDLDHAMILLSPAAVLTVPRPDARGPGAACVPLFHLYRFFLVLRIDPTSPVHSARRLAV